MTDENEPLATRTATRTALRRRTGRIMIALVALNVGLLATHEGEFWPLSIYPMFSRAGRPWNRAVVRELEPAELGAIELTAVPVEITFAHLPGQGVSLRERGVDPIDLANYVSKTGDWDAARQRGLEVMLGEVASSGRVLAVYRVDGSLGGDGAIALRARPVALVIEGEVAAGPELVAALARRVQRT